MSISEKMRLEREELTKLLPGHNKTFNQYHTHELSAASNELYKFLDDPLKGDFPYVDEEDVF